MPRISASYGIVITMYFADHSPPHFHARYGEFQAQIEIASGAVLSGHPSDATMDNRCCHDSASCTIGALVSWMF